MKIKTNLEKVKELFNEGKLKLADADFYAKLGHGLICRDGKVESITEGDEEDF